MGFREYESAFLAGLRLSELPLALLALSTQLAYKATFSYSAYCKITGTYTTESSIDLDFPFYATIAQLPRDLCATGAATPTVPVELNKNHSPEAITFLVISVLATVHALISIIMFFLYWLNLISSRYRRKLMSADFVTTAVFTLAWLASSIAWMVGSVRFVGEIDEKSIREETSSISPCNTLCDTDPSGAGGQSCCSFNYSNSAPIIYASPIAGLVLFVVVLVELPFLFKKTSFQNQISDRQTSHRRFQGTEPAVWTSNSLKGYGRKS